MLKNKADHPLRFTIDGVDYSAAPRGAVTPRIPEHKEWAVLRISGLPLESDRPDGAAAPSPAPPPAPTLSLPPLPGSDAKQDLVPDSDLPVLPKADAKLPELAKADAKPAAKVEVKVDAKVDPKTEKAPQAK